EISRAAKSQTQASQQRMKDCYHKLLSSTRGVVRQATEVLEKWPKGKLKVEGKVLAVEAQMGQLRQFVPLVEKVMTQTKERWWRGIGVFSRPRTSGKRRNWE